jgi:alpha-D-ribose 1-methylphosphonate 5-triphosphate diphosphatase
MWGDFARGLKTVTKTPAEVVGLDDRGELRAGTRADVIRFRMREGTPALNGVWSRGRRVA